MIFEIGLFAESPVADVALEGPGARVDVGVRLEIAGSRERLGAHRALVRLLLRRKGSDLVEVEVDDNNNADDDPIVKLRQKLKLIQYKVGKVMEKVQGLRML